MHVAATNPKVISTEELPADAIEKAKEVFAPELEGKPEDMKAKIMEGKLASYFKEQVLLEQDFVKNPEQTIADMVAGAVQKFGENVSIAQIARVSVK
jgi:elongation factor Ts